MQDNTTDFGDALERFLIETGTACFEALQSE